MKKTIDGLTFGCFILVCVTLIGCAGSSDRSEANDGSTFGEAISAIDEAPKRPDVAPEPPAADLRNDGKNLAFLHWNVQGDDSDPQYVAQDIARDLGKFHVYALSSVHKPDVFESVLKTKWPNTYDQIVSQGGRIPGGFNRHLLIVYDYVRLYRINKIELEEVDGIRLAKDDFPAPIVAHLRDKTDDQEFFLILAHLHPDDADFRVQQVTALRKWVESKKEPVIVLGTLNVEYNFESKQGNSAWNTFQADGLYRMLTPKVPVETEWRDADGDSQNDLAGIASDMIFVAGRARAWPYTMRILTRSRDFPDNERTSNHRPVELFFKTK
ncbi:MAG TPA: hypothetical protein PKD64_04965 [Pirellulaceae bacterium]|nr:hypothetical protein [Pirellulaceae bacterium]HMO91526.1 hypothetical protein [Pirellulaceae bacterium]HMP68223.1 hypothetical protein [Pirellulaceae bacterium]